MKHLHEYLQPIGKKVTENNSFSLHTIQSFCNERQVDNFNDINNHFAIIWITKGNGNYRTDLYLDNADNNCLLFIKPGQLHTVCFNSTTEGYIFSFCKSFLGIEDHDSELLLRSLSQMFNMQFLLLANDTLAEMHNITKQMVKEYNDLNLYRAEILRRYFKIFLIYVSRQIEEPQPVAKHSRNIDLLQSFVALLEQNFKSQKMVADYADQLAVTPNYLNEVIKKITGYPAGYHIRQRVALEAKRKAVYADVGMKEVAYELGFFDLAHFSKFFKNTTGMSFSDFKRNRINLTSPMIIN
ncbi:helix-turn-helix domain-containing protein [Mucilaginibacter jinjuensis]|uniref:Helix-turn-helix domain-containing protein n=1 Tax=Mucilaginibacter jinjuensis TaxID=1176721 RepID=A0ABY7T0A4_9SPHI|nr:helix-turn-helix domain-containing protein [Mucilaginibacter jinjuensis]WCT09854.1 helix-turn-helix domain-containing protein [Mucilaginibacter jinjuensis]